MIKGPFIGYRPSHYHMNGLVKCFITSEVLIWSSWNSVMSIIAVFAANQLQGGNIEIAATALSVHLLVRVCFELFSSKVLAKVNESKKLLAIMVGIILISLSFIGFSLTKTVAPFYLFYALSGVGLGIASPLKNSLFSTHLDKNKEASEWSVYDSLVFIGMASSAAIGGVIAKTFGFGVLFWASAVFNLMGIIPYFLYAQKRLIKLIFGKKDLNFNIEQEENKLREEAV